MSIDLLLKISTGVGESFFEGKKGSFRLLFSKLERRLTDSLVPYRRFVDA